MSNRHQVLCLRGSGFFPLEILNDIGGHYFSENDRLSAESRRVSDHIGQPRDILITFMRPNDIEHHQFDTFDVHIQRRFAATGWITHWQAPHKVLKRIRDLQHSII